MKIGFSWRRGVVAAVGLLALAPGLAAQSPATGSIHGRVVDSATGRGLPGAVVSVLGSGRGTTAGVDGVFNVTGVPAGSVSLEASMAGYAPKTVTGVEIRPGAAAEQNVSLTAQALALEGITVSAAREKGSVSRALDAQRTAVGVISATTSEQIARSPDANAAQAVQRVSGVTVQDGRYVFVRGLGERYTTTSLNGARIPSPEPERKVVPLDLFPAGLLESITTSKTFTPDQPGDFSGARVDLRTKTFPTRRMSQLSLSGGVTTQALGSDVLLAPGGTRDWLGLGAAGRERPTSLAQVSDFSRLQPAQVNELVRSLRDVWSPSRDVAVPNASASLSTGGQAHLAGRRVGYLGSLSYARNQHVRDGELRARAVAANAAGDTRPYNPFLGTTSQSSVLWGGLLNLSTYLGANTKLELDNTYDRSADNEAHLDWGTLEEFSQVDSVRRTSLRYVERSVLSSQLRAEHQLGLSHRLDGSLTGSRVTRAEPDRSDLAYGYETAPTGERLPLAWLGFIPEAAKRTYGDLAETALEGALNYAFSFGAAGQEGTLKLGSSARRVHRDASSASYNLRALGLTAAQRALPPEEIFSGAYTAGDASNILLEPNSAGGSYAARDRVTASYAMADYPLTPWLRVVGGARLENWELRLDSEPTAGGSVRTERGNTDVLPSLALNFRLSEIQNLRFSATQTLARPEYRELSPISYRDMLGEREVFGDSSLIRTLVQNYDARWEWYPSSGELLSAALFAKHFDHPIEPIDVATSGAEQLSFTNAEGAYNYGVELEARKRLGFLSASLDPLAVFANATLMRSEIRTGNSTLSALTNDHRPMVGQAPYVVNAGLSYARSPEGASATLLYNVVGRRIVSAAVVPIRFDTYELPRRMLDFSLRLPLAGDLSARLDAKNLLDSPYEERQGDVVRYRYRTGRLVSLGVSWRR